MTIRRAIRRAAGVALAAALLPAVPVLAQSYPSQPIRFVLGSPPGGSVDALARVIGKYLGAAVGQPVIIDNRPGGSNKIAMDLVASSAPDGHTLIVVGSSQPLVEAAALSAGHPRPFDTLRDFTPVAMLVTNTYALAVHPSVPVKDAREFIQLAKARPGEISYGSSGVAKSDHIAGAMLERMTGIRMLHVPYKGIADAVREMLSGRILASFGSLPVMEPHIRAGKLRLVGVVSSERSFQFPDAPTLAEAIPLRGYAVETWIGIMAPVKTPGSVVNRLNGEINRMLRDDAFVKSFLHPLGLSPWPHAPDEMANIFRGELQKYTKLFKDIGIKLE